MTGIYMKMVYTSVLINESTYEKAIFTVLKVFTNEMSSLLKHCVFAPAAWVNRLNPDCKFTHF